MNLDDTLGPIIEHLQRSASVDTVYGEPIESNSHTVIPIAKVSYGFGAGGGSGGGTTAEEEDESGEETGSGFGGGGGVSATPVGALEISETQTNFVRFNEPRRVVAAFVVGVVLGLLFGRR